jgi:hypothetical protein
METTQTDLFTKLKVIAMYKCGKPVLFPPKKLTLLERKQYDRYIESDTQKTETEIDTLFNEICYSELFPNIDYMLLKG